MAPKRPKTTPRRSSALVTTTRTGATTSRRAEVRNLKTLQKAVAGVRREVEGRAARFVRDAERKLLKQMHAATEDQVRKLERRVARLERILRP
jgi:hypothetical protein